MKKDYQKYLVCVIYLTKIIFNYSSFHKYRTFAAVAQAELPIFSIFVNYVKILCKQSYVNYVDRPRFMCLKSAQIPISGENRKIPAPYIETGKTTDGSPAARRLVKRKMRKKRFRYFNHAPLYVTARFRRLPP